MNGLVYIIVLVYNGKKWLNNCLKSVLATTYPNYKVLVIDNASSDGSVEYAKAYFPGVQIIENKKNYGFAEGNNIGIKYSLAKGAEYIVLLNQDTKVEPAWVSELIKVAENSAEIGILSPMQYDYEGIELDKNFKIIFDSGKYVNPDFIEADTIIGAAILLKKSLCQKIGMFDPVFFCYHEESDLCRRYKYFGYKIGIAVKSKIFHWHSLLHEESLNKENKNLFLRNEFIYWLKDPNRMFVISFCGYFMWKLFTSVKSFGFLKGICYFCVLCMKQISALRYIPPVILKRHEEKLLFSRKT